MVKHSYSTIIFDWDGTLADTLELWVTVAQEGFNRRHITGLSREEIIRNTIIKYDNVSKLGIPEADKIRFGAEINALFAERCQETILQPNALQTLKHLIAANKKLALFTSSGRDAITKSLECLSLETVFQTIITHEDVARHKPDPQGIFIIAETLQTSLEEMIIIGDTRNDILSGQRANIKTIIYYPEIHEKLYDRDYLLGLNADWYIRDLAELIEIVN